MTAAREHVHRQPVLTSPYNEPDRHWKIVNDEAQDEIASQRREADEPLPTTPGRQIQRDLKLDDRDVGHGLIDKLRSEVRLWRERGWPGTSNATRELLEYWSRAPGEGPVFSLFYAQREAIEAVIFLTEKGNGSHWMVRCLKMLGDEWNHGLTRLALRMATGTGKTAVMACLIAWYAVNRKREHRGDTRGLAKNVDRVVVICPGRTIKDRLRGLNPRARRNLYDEWRLVPPTLRRRLGSLSVDIVNWEKLQPKKDINYRDFESKKGGTTNLTRSQAVQLASGEEKAQTPESLDEMWERVLESVHGTRTKRERVVVLNDEGHHCWQRKEGEKPGTWMEALHALREHPRMVLAQAIDLTATPIFINPAKTHLPEQASRLKIASLVPWVISEFALMESMEAGLVKIPQPPKGDNTGKESPLRNLFEANGGQKLVTIESMRLVREGAEILYEDYRDTSAAWQSANDPQVGHPVLIVVANNKVNARAIYEMLGGRRNPEGGLERSDFELLSNVPRTGADESECEERTILVLSKSNNPETAEEDQISGGALGLREVCKEGATEDELREVLQTVAQPGERGQSVRCVVSVGMLTEGWDCQRVTHILGYRKFGSQLLCEQTMGRALRRRDYENLEDVERRDNGLVERRLPAEYATVFGVPFERQTGSGGRIEPSPPDKKTEVKPVLDRVDQYRIWVPDFASYTLSAPGVDVTLDPSRVIEAYPVEGQESRTICWVTTAGKIGEIRTLSRRVDEQPGWGIWQLARELVLLLTQQAEEQGENKEIGQLRRGVLFGECLKVVREWLAHENIAVMESDLGGEGMRELAKSAILDALTVEGKPAQKIGNPRDPRQELRSAGNWRPFLTGLKTIVELNRSELNVAACHSELEAVIARCLDSSKQVDAFVRNHGPERIEIPYKYKGGQANYVPDFFVRCPTKNGIVPHIVLEGKGQPDERSEQKGWWTDNWWIPCANAAGEDQGQRWVRRELSPHDDVESVIQSAIREITEQ